MTNYGDPRYLAGVAARHTAVEWSPDGACFIFVVTQGNLDRNTNDYTLLLFRVNTGFPRPPEKLITLSSSSSKPAIQKATWIDSKTIAFLGENPGELQQLYTFDISTKKVKQLTRHPTNVISYGVPIDVRDRIFYLAEPAPKPLISDNDRKYGMHISRQWLPELLSGESSDISRSLDTELFVCDVKGALSIHQIKTRDRIPGAVDLFASPNGKYVVLPTLTRDVPASWLKYDDSRLRLSAESNGVLRLTLVDADRATYEPLIDAPDRYWFPKAAWTSDSQAVIAAGTFLPQTESIAQVTNEERYKEYVAEVQISGRKITPIVQGSMKLLHWNRVSQTLVLQSIDPVLTADLEMPIVVYRKTDMGWEVVDAGETEEHRYEISLEEDMNTPPKLVASDQKSKVKTPLLELNPGLKKLALARVKEVRFNARDGHVVTGGLYIPPNYVSGAKLPLVIQTHGWNPNRFWPDGPYSSAFAAQPLASKGIFVLQLEENDAGISSPEEGPRQMSTFEGAVDYLDALGMIDPLRVGIIGFSRTCLHVKYALTHSAYRFAASTQADCADGGYFQYIANLNHNTAMSADSEKLNGGPPFDRGLNLWCEQASSFRLHRVNSPVRIESYEPWALVLGWEWFVGLLRLGKPVDMIYIPGGEHVLVKPWERMTSQQGNVDWFSFWLNGQEDPDSSKAEQYRRWRELRKQQEANGTR